MKIRGVIVTGPRETGKSELIRTLYGDIEEISVLESTERMISFDEEPGVDEQEEGIREWIKSCFAKSQLICFTDLEAFPKDSEWLKCFVKYLKLNMDEYEGTVVVLEVEDDFYHSFLRDQNYFQRKYFTHYPNYEERKAGLKRILNEQGVVISDIELANIARITPGKSYGDLKRCLNKALLSSEAINETAFRDEKQLKTKCTWDDIVGYEEIKNQLREAVYGPRLHKEAYERLGIDSLRGVLLVGPPGTGKTMLAQALVSEGTMQVLELVGPDVLTGYVGESERAIRDIFRKARKLAPCVILIDDIEILGRRRGTEDPSSIGTIQGRMLSTLLNEIDGVEDSKDIVIVACSSKPELIDEALTRPGRLDRLIEVDLPNESERFAILKSYFSKLEVSLAVDLGFYSGFRTLEWSCLDLKHLVKRAAYIAAERKQAEITVHILEDSFKTFI